MLRAMLWAKAHMSHLESTAGAPRRLFSALGGKVDESSHLDRQKPVGSVQEVEGQRCRLKFFKISADPDEGLPFQYSDPSRIFYSFVTTCRGFKVGVSNPTSARGMTSIIQ